MINSDTKVKELFDLCEKGGGGQIHMVVKEAGVPIAGIYCIAEKELVERIEAVLAAWDEENPS